MNLIMLIKKNNNFKFLAQGTLYPDVVESSAVKGSASQVIKSHHNVGGLPEDMNFELVEPFRDLFKDEVREVGRRLGVPDKIVDRHPFPGPGLAIRIIGEITPEKLEILRKADKIFIEALKSTLTDEEAEKQERFGLDSEFWVDLAEDAGDRGIIVHCLIFNSKGQVFIQKRNVNRKNFPAVWEASVGGKVEQGENIRAALEREMIEETGWKVKRIVDYWGHKDWNVTAKQSTEWENYKPMRTFIFLVEVEGDLDNPKLEVDKVDGSKWVNETQIDFLDANKNMDDVVTPFSINKFFTENWFSKSKKTTLYHDTWQAFCVLTPVQTVGVMGDGRTYENVLGLRAVTAADGMTADWARLPYDFLAGVSNKIINEVRGVNRVVYDISSKPPATIEWE
jgi:GMP synthase PP-ATPase subunit/8-oxo-dGTP pyrophosphatase MutT (NUDIX family)